jgi:hypothetical protein
MPPTGVRLDACARLNAHRIAIGEIRAEDAQFVGNVSIEMLNARHATCHLSKRRQNCPHLLLRHGKETDMTGYRILILIAAILITGCEALVFVGTTAVN